MHPFIVELKEKPEIKLDWEHTEYKWVKLEDVNNLENTVPDLHENIKNIFD